MPSFQRKERATTSNFSFKGDIMIEVMREFWMFAKENKKFWLIPIVLVLVAIGTLLVFTQGSVIAPFIYSIF